MTSGILLLAHKAEAYTRMAWNLAALIRQSGCDLPIAVLTDENIRAVRGKPPVFNQIIALEAGDNIPFYAKTRLNKYTPFDRTLFLDCDAFPLKDITGLMDSLGTWPILFQNFGPGIKNKATHWYKPELLYPLYGIPKERAFHETNSSFILWDKCEAADEFWTLAEHLYACEWVEDYSHNIGYYPDELAFNTALLITGIPQPLFKPILFHAPPDGPILWPQINEAYWLAGMYGNAMTTHPHIWQEYHRRICDLIRQHTGEYGFAVRAADKASNGGRTRPRWKGLRKRERPDEIAKIFEKYADHHRQNN